MNTTAQSTRRTREAAALAGGLSARERAALRGQLAQVSAELRGWVADLDARIARLAAAIDPHPAAAERIGGGS